MAPQYHRPTSQDVVALACTVIGVGPGGSTSMLARVAITNYRGEVLLDCYVAPTMPVTDYRTATTGIEPGHLHSVGSANKFNDVQQWVATTIRDKVVVGYALWNDLSGQLPFYP
ncbi:hypothetical protein EWM64_g2 [Hericium alpestre]|uniref:Exonuclease domain-containing protein n=1 Tax=Hericium alpestre TaxID=135208 RepID=A0A4Z0ADE0_9AGAM|nr:hypothetical protein EWM64_g2 [Hericium alpestre]